MQFIWQRHGGYEVSTRGDPRFSALNALMPDGRSIEQHYQCDIKGYQPGGLDWKLGKGKPPLNTGIDLWPAYLALWQVWSERNLHLMRKLFVAAKGRNAILSDRFATTPVNQARALATILTDLSG